MTQVPGATTPIGLARYAKEFLEAALAADDKMGNKKGHEIFAPIPVMYLVAHSIELSLKSYLLHKGVTLEKLKQIGHDLEKCYRKAKELGLDSHIKLNSDDESVLSVLSKLHSKKQLNYIVTGEKEFPVFGPLEVLNKKLTESIGPLVGYDSKA
jgi:hypothetical protein